MLPVFRQSALEWLCAIVIGACVATLLAGAFRQASAQTPVQRVSAKQTNVIEGAELFRTHCAACHGRDAKGNGPATAALRKPPADLTTLSRQNGGAFPVYRIQQILKAEAGVPAHGDRDMPVWGSVLRQMSREQDLGHLRVRNLTRYLEKIQRD